MSLIPTGVRAVYFDAVGTLIFPHPPAHEVYATLAAKQGVILDPKAVRERFLAAYRVEEHADRANGWITSEERERTRWRTIVTSALAGLPDPEAGFLELWEHFAQPGSWTVNPDAASVLNEIAGRGLILGMGTNYDSRVVRVVAGLPDLAPVAKRLVVSAAVGFRKPAAGFFRELLRLAGCDPSEVLFVGDDPENDYDGARAAGLHAVLLGGGIKSLRELV
jgi:putative hydrolase of the HAD superfamily